MRDRYGLSTASTDSTGRLVATAATLSCSRSIRSAVRSRGPSLRATSGSTTSSRAAAPIASARQRIVEQARARGRRVRRRRPAARDSRSRRRRPLRESSRRSWPRPGVPTLIASRIETGLASMCEVRANTSHGREQPRHVVARAEEVDAVVDAQVAGTLFERFAARPVADDQELRGRQLAARRGRHFEKQLVIFFRPQRGDDRHDRIGRADAQLAADGGDIAAPGRSDRCRRRWESRMTLPAGKPSFSTRYRPCDRRDGDEGVGDRREHAVEPADAVGPAGAVQRREDDRHADASGGQPAPEHFVAGADGDDGVDLAVAQQLRQPRPDAQVVFVARAANRGPGSRRPAFRPAGRGSFRQHSSGANDCGRGGGRC